MDATEMRPMKSLAPTNFLPKLRRRLGPALLVLLTACGTNPTEDADIPEPEVDAFDVVVEDVQSDVEDAQSDAADDTVTGCVGSPGFDCVQDCATDVSFPGVCIDGAWSCPPEMPIRFDECGPSCPGSPEPCCDEVGASSGQQECVLGGWSCGGGSAPDWCCTRGPEVCVSACAEEPRAMACARGELICSEGTFDRTECGCGPSPPFCCEASGASAGAVCTESGWGCPPDTANEFCQAGPGSLEGTWSELARLDCDGSESISDDPIAEFTLSGGEFELTYASGMFETFKNYWGSYFYRFETARASFVIDGGNSNPTFAVLNGRVVELDGGQAEWRGFWFGTNNDDPVPPDHCGYRMQR